VFSFGLRRTPNSVSQQTFQPEHFLDLHIVEAVTHQGRDTKAAIDLVKPDAVYSDKLPCW